MLTFQVPFSSTAEPLTPASTGDPLRRSVYVTVAEVGPSIVTDVTFADACLASDELLTAAIASATCSPFCANETRFDAELEPSKNVSQFCLIAALVSAGRGPIASTDEFPVEVVVELFLLLEPPQPTTRRTDDAARAIPQSSVLDRGQG